MVCIVVVEALGADAARWGVYGVEEAVNVALLFAMGLAKDEFRLVLFMDEVVGCVVYELALE